MVAFNKLVSGLESLKELIRIILFKIKPLVNNYKILTTDKILEWEQKQEHFSHTKNYAYCKNNLA